MKQSESTFPQQIDPRLYYSDTSLNYVDLMTNYQNLVKQGRYTQASELLNSSDAAYFGAWLLNLLEDRVYKVGKFIKDSEENELLIQDDEPRYTEGNMWVSDNTVLLHQILPRLSLRFGNYRRI